MQQLKETAAQFEEALKAALTTTVFPDYPEWAATTAKQSLHFESQETLGCGLETFKALMRGDNDLYTASFALNSLQARTPKELGLSLKAYIELQEAVAELAAKWNGYVQPIKEKLAKKLAVQARISEGLPNGKMVKIGQA
jgi:hypothetical protein